MPEHDVSGGIPTTQRRVVLQYSVVVSVTDIKIAVVIGSDSLW